MYQRAAGIAAAAIGACVVILGIISLIRQRQAIARGLSRSAGWIGSIARGAVQSVKNWFSGLAHTERETVHVIDNRGI